MKNFQMDTQGMDEDTMKLDALAREKIKKK
jgi:hypothetical protein